MPQSLKQASLYDQHSVSPHVPLSLDSLSLDSDISPQYNSQDSSRDGSPLHAASDRARVHAVNPHGDIVIRIV